MGELGDLGVTGLVASAVAELINRGLGLKGRKAFVTFAAIVGVVLAVKLGAEYRVELARVWTWMTDFLSAVAAGSGAHQLWKPGSVEGKGEEQAWESTSSSGSGSSF